jgi:PAS domain S-box-containing protein
VLEATTDALWEWDVPTGEMDLSPEWFSMLGYAQDDLPPTYETWSGLIHPDDKRHAEEALREHLEGASTRFEAEFRFRCRDGEWKWVLGRGKAVHRDQTGRPVLVVGTIQDVHRRTREKEGLLHRSSFLETLLDTIPCPAFFKDKTGAYRGCNPVFADQILGLPREAVIGATVYDLPQAIPRELADVYHRKDMELIEAPGHQVYEAQVQCADGVKRQFVFNKATFYDRSGQAAGIVGLMLDVTERNQAEQEVLESRERLEDILHALPVGVVIIDRSSKKIVEVNPAAVMMIGSPPNEIIGQICHRFICPAERGSCPILDLGAEVNNSERVLLTSNGEDIPILKTVLPLTVEGRDYLLECFKDIRDLKEAEKERIQKEKLQAIVEMAGSICHEMNQPLQVLSGLSELLLMSDSEEGPHRETLEKISAQLNRVSGITWKLRNLTQYQTRSYLEGRIVDIDQSCGVGDSGHQRQ